MERDCSDNDPLAGENEIYIKCEKNLSPKDVTDDTVSDSSFVELPAIKVEPEYDYKSDNEEDTTVKEEIECIYLKENPSTTIKKEIESGDSENDDDFDSRCAHCNIEIRWQSEDESCFRWFCNDCYSTRDDVDFKKTIEKKFSSCANCLIAINSKLKLVSHNCSLKGIYTCVDCSRLFIDKPSIERHLKNRSVKFACSECNMNFCDRQSLESHCCDAEYNSWAKVFVPEVALVESEVPKQKVKFTCNICNKDLANKYSFDKHMFVHFPESKWHRCWICKKVFITRGELKDHLSRHENNTAEESAPSINKTYICDQCGKAFNYISNLRRHVDTHDTDKKYNCHLCDKTFKHHSYLKLHIDDHEGKRKFECELCKKTFRRIAHLKIHLNTHENKRNYKCHICEKCFNDPSNLKRHVESHNTTKQYKCHLCDKSFSQIAYLKVHVDAHEDKRKYKCRLCDKSFNYRCSLKWHAGSHENKKI